eukprot:TRINITY_DN7645_c0_g1_i2.p1 TRINITY_DN7645_c0_g1~~TRINITY_DN7645_c0_g1_i2.p1  ORF type:complete len:304 (-),score=50.14 TRINITY_DN7645_c0_g1_i2:1-795(-)
MLAQMHAMQGTVLMVTIDFVRQAFRQYGLTWQNLNREIKTGLFHLSFGVEFVDALCAFDLMKVLFEEVTHEIDPTYSLPVYRARSQLWRLFLAYCVDVESLSNLPDQTAKLATALQKIVFAEPSHQVLVCTAFRLSCLVNTANDFSVLVQKRLAHIFHQKRSVYYTSCIATVGKARKLLPSLKPQPVEETDADNFELMKHGFGTIRNLIAHCTLLSEERTAVYLTHVLKLAGLVLGCPPYANIFEIQVRIHQLSELLGDGEESR